MFMKEYMDKVFTALQEGFNWEMEYRKINMKNLEELERDSDYTIQASHSISDCTILFAINYSDNDPFIEVYMLGTEHAYNLFIHEMGCISLALTGSFDYLLKEFVNVHANHLASTIPLTTDAMVETLKDINKDNPLSKINDFENQIEVFASSMEDAYHAMQKDMSNFIQEGGDNFVS